MTTFVLQISFQTEAGQVADLITAPEDSVDLSKFSLERFVLHLLRQLAMEITRPPGTLTS